MFDIFQLHKTKPTVLKINGDEAFCITVINGWLYNVFMTKDRDNCPHKPIKAMITHIQTNIKIAEGQRDMLRWILQNETNADWSVAIDQNPKNVADQASFSVKIVKKFTNAQKNFTEKI